MIKNALKKWFINPCKKCIVNACCNKMCNKLEVFITNQEDVSLIIGIIIATILLIICGFILSLTDNPFNYFLVGITGWLITGMWIYIWHVKGNDEKWYHITFIIFVPVIVLGLLIGVYIMECRRKSLRR